MFLEKDYKMANYKKKKTVHDKVIIFKTRKNIAIKKNEIK